MTIRNLDLTLAPRSVALIGASDREHSVGRIVLDNVRATYRGAIYPVNLKHDEVLGLRCYRKVSDLPEAPDVAVVMTPATTVPALVEQLGTRGCKSVVVLSAGVGVANGLRQEMLAAARPHTLRIIGPNTIGLLAPRVDLNASFSHLAPLRGRLGLVSQSGAIVSSMIDWAVAEGVGFSQMFSLGDMADVDVGDCLDLLALDDQTDAILVYLESITNPRKFMSAARAASRIKPVIAVKPGRHVEAAKAAATHTGALAGADRVVEAVLHRAGIIRVADLEDLFDAAEVTGRYRPMVRARTAIVTNGGGAGVLAVDELLDRGAMMAELSSATIGRLDAVLPPTWSRSNPVDIIGDASPERYRAAIEGVAADESVDAILVMNCPTGIADPVASARSVAGLTRNGTIGGKPVLACWLGKHAADAAREQLQSAGVGGFDTPAHAAQAVALLTRWEALRRQLEQVPSSETSMSSDAEAMRRLLVAAAAEGRSILTEVESKALLASCGIDVPETIFCTTADEVEAAAQRVLGRFPQVVVKMMSKRITHKSDIGGVALGLTEPGEARLAAEAIRTRFLAAHAGEILDGFTVQPMIRRRHSHELLAGLTTDPVFGPVVVFGSGGTSVEVVDDTAIGLAPLDAVLAADILDRTRVSRLLAGYRDVPPADRSAIVRTLLALSQLSMDFPAIVAIDINPLVASPDGAIALDARVEIDPSRLNDPTPNRGLVLRPYPSGRDSIVELNGAEFDLRPIRPTDAALYPAFLERMDPEDMRRRFLVPMPTLSHSMLIRLTQLDYDRDIAFIGLDRGTGALAGIARYSTDPDRRVGEFGVLVRSDLKGLGLGRALMARLVGFARDEGVEELFGLVLPDNERMLRLCRELGFSVDGRVPGENLLRVTLDLRVALHPAPRT
jgi:acetyltransferase